MHLSFNVRRLGIGFGQKGHDRGSGARRDNSRPTRSFFAFSWFSSNKTKSIDRPPTPAPHTFLQGSSAPSSHGRRSGKLLKSSQTNTNTPSKRSLQQHTGSSSSPAPASEAQNLGNDDEYVGTDEMSEEERAQLNDFARGLKEMMEELRRAEESADLPPTKTADGTPLPTIEEEDEPLSSTNSPLSSPRLIPNIHSNTVSHERTTLPLRHDPIQVSPQNENQSRVNDSRPDELQVSTSPIYTTRLTPHFDDLPCRPLTPEPFALPGTLEGIPELCEDEGEADDNIDASVSLLASSNDSDTSSMSESVLGLQGLLPLTHDPSTPSTPTPTFESSFFPISSRPLTKPPSRSRLVHSVSLPISLFARPLSTATSTNASLGDGTGLLLDEVETDVKGADDLGESEDGEREGETESTRARQIENMRSKLGEIRKRLSELSGCSCTYSEKGMQCALGEEGEGEKVNDSGGGEEKVDDSIDELKRSLEYLTSEKERLELALSSSESARAQLKVQNALLLQTMDLTWEVTRQQLREQESEISALKTQIEKLQGAVKDVVESSLGTSPVDPVDPSVPGSRELKRRYRAEMTCPRTTSSSSSSSSPTQLLTSPSTSTNSSPHNQLTTPPATPDRGSAALLDSQVITPCLGGTSLSTSNGYLSVGGEEDLSVPGQLAGVPARSGSWHGLVRNRRKEKARNGGGSEYRDSAVGCEVEDGVVLSEGRCQIKRRAGSMDLKSVNSFWSSASNTSNTTSRLNYGLSRREINVTS